MEKQFNMNDVISLYLLNEQKENDEKRKIDNSVTTNFGYYSISQTGNCLRKQFWDIKDGNHPDLEALRRFKLGNLLQDFTDNVLLSHYGKDLIKIERTITIPIQTPNKKEDEWIFLTGRIDHLYTFIETGNRRYFEPIEAKYLTNKLIKDLKEPQRKHKYQINSYILGMNSKLGYIYYLDHLLYAKTFDFTFDPVLWNDTKNRLFSLHHWIKSDEVPQAESAYAEDDMKNDCFFCHHWKRCKNIEKK